jgi:hypothetical protein
MIYLASPYSHPDAAVRDQRYLAACRAAVSLLRNGETVFSPVVQGHALSRFGLPTDWAFWQRHDEQHLARCDEVFVLALPGWEESEGVQHEISLARRLGKVVRYYPESSLSGRNVCPVSPQIGQHAHPGHHTPERDVGQRGAIEKTANPMSKH